MRFLARVLKVQAVFWLLAGVALLAIPATVVRVLTQIPFEQVWLRAMGVSVIVLGLLMILVAQRAEVWWWAWAFTVLEAGMGSVFVLRGLFGGRGAEWPWWSLGSLGAFFAVLNLVGLAQAGREKPFV
jgi:hypothetical protein